MEQNLKCLICLKVILTKEFKIIRKYSTKNKIVIMLKWLKKEERPYTRKVGDEYIFDDHVGAARTEREAEGFTRSYFRRW